MPLASPGQAIKDVDAALDRLRRYASDNALDLIEPHKGQSPSLGVLLLTEAQRTQTSATTEAALRGAMGALSAANRCSIHAVVGSVINMARAEEAALERAFKGRPGAPAASPEAHLGDLFEDLDRYVIKTVSELLRAQCK